MKSLTAFAALAIAAICCPDAAVFAQTSADVEALLARIERDVRPAADPRGSPISLEAYMQRLHVQGVSIAVVDSGFRMRRRLRKCPAKPPPAPNRRGAFSISKFP